jgi:lipoprotein NlpD
MQLVPMPLIAEDLRCVRYAPSRTCVMLLALAVLAGCASSTNPRAPVEERGVGMRAAAASAPQDAAESTKTGADNAGKPGYYTVKQGDTVIRVALETGQNWKDLIKWNNLDAPNTLEVGQVLRVVPPGADPHALTTRAVTAPRVEARPLDAPKAAASAPVVTAQAAIAAPAALPTPAAAPVVVPSPAVRDGDDAVAWLWPASGKVISNFDEPRTKGLAISGKAGDPVLAAADGKVVYAGSGLRGYGNLVILKHNNTYLTAYAHNQTLLVKEEQSVRRGQKIAEMGSTDAERVQLHFEIRRLGKPVDPTKLLPSR